MTEVNKPIVQGREKSVGTVEKNNQIHKVARKSFWWSSCWPSLVPFALSKLKAKLFILASHYGSHYSILKADFEWMTVSLTCYNQLERQEIFSIWEIVCMYLNLARIKEMLNNMKINVKTHSD